MGKAVASLRNLDTTDHQLVKCLLPIIRVLDCRVGDVLGKKDICRGRQLPKRHPRENRSRSASAFRVKEEVSNLYDFCLKPLEANDVFAQLPVNRVCIDHWAVPLFLSSCMAHPGCQA